MSMSETYGEKVRRLRKERGWTQDQLAEKAEVSKRTLQDVEADRASKSGPQRATRTRIDSALGSAEEEVLTALAEAATDWPRDVRTMVLIIGSWLAALSEPKRDEEFSTILARTLASGDRT